MDAELQRQHAQTFYELHQKDLPLVLFNAWDVATARAIAKSSAAIATSSGAVAASMGFPDGERAPFDLVEGLVARMTDAVGLPVTVDLEAGYGDEPEAAAASAERIMEAGAIGINIEDSLLAGERRLAPAELHAEKIAAVRDAAQRKGQRLFINARTDPFLLKIGSPDECLEEVARRAKLYADAGADGLFVPGLIDLGLIETVVHLTPLPVNVMVMQGAPSIAELAKVGVHRISFGPWPMLAAMRAIGRAASEVVATGFYGSFLD